MLLKLRFAPTQNQSVDGSEQIFWCKIEDSVRVFDCKEKKKPKRFKIDKRMI